MAVAREPHQELGIGGPLRWGMGLLRVEAIADATEVSDAETAKRTPHLRSGKLGCDSEGTGEESDDEVVVSGH